MSLKDFTRSCALNNIPKTKIELTIQKIKESKSQEEYQLISTAFTRYASSNIPIQYWSLRMEKCFSGDQRLLQKYNEYITDIKQSYLSGKSICFAGNHGLGKTLTSCCILKRAIEKGYTSLYTTLSDVVSVLVSAPYEERYMARRELCMVDFLVIDEFDSRFIATDNAADLYARTLETIFRTRIQNNLPTIMCTNSPNIIETFNGPLKASIDSLFNGYLEEFPVFGNDFRKK